MKNEHNQESNLDLAIKYAEKMHDFYVTEQEEQTSIPAKYSCAGAHLAIRVFADTLKILKNGNK